MYSDDDAMLEFAKQWYPYGGGEDSDIFVRPAGERLLQTACETGRGLQGSTPLASADTRHPDRRSVSPRQKADCGLTPEFFGTGDRVPTRTV